MLLKRFLASLTLGVAVVPALAEMPKELNFGIIATESAQNLKEDWQPLISDMTRRLGVKVNAFFAPDYAGVIEAMRFGKVHLAWMGNKSGMEAVDRASGEVFAQIVYADGAPGYWSLLITHKDSPYKSLEDVLKNGKSINFGIGDPNSTSGFLVPTYYVFALNNVDYKTHFKTIRSANHEANLMAVVNRQLDVATNNTENWDKFKARFPDKINDARVPWKSPLIPSDPMLWRKDLDSEAKAKIKEFLLSYGTGPDAAREQAVLKKLTYSGFKESTNAQLIPIRQLELFKDRTKLENDVNMNAAEKQAKLAEINRKLADLNEQLAALKK
jgi:phosphonate transport system substrate-binding protein